MNTISYLFVDLDHLHSFLLSPEMLRQAEGASSVLVQIFSAENEIGLLGRIVEGITACLPSAVVVGSTSVGEILGGALYLGKIVLAVSFFSSTRLVPMARHCSSCDFDAGQNFMDEIGRLGPHVAGVLLFTTPLTSDATALFSRVDVPFPVFGSGAGVYDFSSDSVIFCGTEFIRQGVVAVAFLGTELRLYTESYLGWRPLSGEMTMTSVDGLVAREVDRKPAYDLYKKYLNIKNDENFFMNVLEFPFLIQRDGYTIARVPFFTHRDNSIQFIADIYPGEKFKIGYGDPGLIIRHALEVQDHLASFAPQSIFIYSCISHRFLLQNDANCEIRPFESIAPTAGYFSYGEIISHQNRIQMLNSSIVFVGLREGAGHANPAVTGHAPTDRSAPPKHCDPYSDKHNRIISSLLQFISVLTAELEQANRNLVQISETDKLTQIYNRTKLDCVLKDEILKSALFQTEFSIILLDIDNFKAVNDRYGHLSGDLVLAGLADILKHGVRSSDSAGRWGGEEFLLILPSAGLAQALAVAEQIRGKIDSHMFPHAIHITCSLGVASYRERDSWDTLMLRADQALYQAKARGKNRVEPVPAVSGTLRLPDRVSS